MKQLHDVDAGKMERREFIAGAGAVLGAATLASRRATAQPKIRLGLIGCGQRGIWLTELFRKHGGYQITAGADYFQDRLDEFAGTFDIPKYQLFTGLSGYKKLLESGVVDAVAIESPPYFHPEQTAAAVAAGKHAYVAKPVAVDVPGCKSIEASGVEGKKKGLCVLVDFQTRADVFFQEAIRRVHAGALGDFSFGESSYHASIPFQHVHHYMEEDPKNPENRLRAWGVDKVLSGDIITEQNIHTLDVASWIMNTPPLAAMGTCSQKLRPIGDCNDHFSVIYEYPDKVDVSFTSRQFPAFGTKPDGIRNRMFGSKGVLETSYGGEVLIRGDLSGRCSGEHRHVPRTDHGARIR
jgi:predicted dehydrogenase